MDLRSTDAPCTAATHRTSRTAYFSLLVQEAACTGHPLPAGLTPPPPPHPLPAAMTPLMPNACDLAFAQQAIFTLSAQTEPSLESQLITVASSVAAVQILFLLS